MTNQIVNTLSYGELLSELKDNSIREVQKFNLDEPASKTLAAYQKAITIKR